MITEDYVSFETAKLLKERGFDEPTLWFYVGDGTKYTAHKTTGDDWWRRPTLQMAMKWLREKHVLVLPEPKSFTLDGEVASWVYNIWCDDNCEVDADFFDGEPFEKYEEACEGAIRYCLQNLI